MRARIPIAAVLSLAAALVAACKPHAAGRCASTADCSGGAFCAAGGICVADATPPTVSVTNVPAADAVQGWVARSGPDLVVTALVTDQGSGPDRATLSLSPCPAGVQCDYPGAVQPSSATPDSETFRFDVPRSVQAAGSEAPVQFKVHAFDVAGNEAVQDGTPLLIDDKPPVVQLAQVQYASAAPSYDAVCGRADASGCAAGTPCPARGFHCGRGPAAQLADHVLRDDSVLVTFAAFDCGSGVVPSTATWQAESAGISTNTAAATPNATVSGNCPPGVPQPAGQRFVFTLPIGALQALDAPGGDGTTRVRLSQTVLDAVGLQGKSAALTTASPDGDGVVLVSLVRWRAQLGGVAVGAPALLPAAAAPDGGTRALVLASAALPLADGGAAAAAPNLLVLAPNGAELASNSTIDGGIVGDVAVGQQGTLYMPGGNTIQMGAADGGAGLVVFAPSSCVVPAGTVLGAPVALTLPVMANGNVIENAVAVATTRTTPGNAYFLDRPDTGNAACKMVDQNVVALPTNAGNLTGVSISSGAQASTSFVSHAAGFTSIDGSNGFSTSGATFNTAGVVGPLLTPSAPAVRMASATEMHPIFGTVPDASSASAFVRGASKATCGLAGSPCWTADQLTAPAAVSHTPVFAGTVGYAADDSGNVLAFALATGGPVANARTIPPKGGVTALSPPLLLGQAIDAPANPLLVVQSDGVVRLLQLTQAAPGGDVTMLAAGGFAAGGKRPLTPVADVRGTGSVVYVVDGGCDATGKVCGPSWTWALQLDPPPMAAASGVSGVPAWVRPGRDSCNTRNAQAACP